MRNKRKIEMGPSAKIKGKLNLGPIHKAQFVINNRKLKNKE
jgi:hypothetical protein